MIQEFFDKYYKYIIAIVLCFGAIMSLFWYIDRLKMEKLKTEAESLRERIKVTQLQVAELDKKIAVAEVIIQDKQKELNTNDQKIIQADKDLRDKKQKLQDALDKYDNSDGSRGSSMSDSELRQTLCELYGCN